MLKYIAQFYLTIAVPLFYLLILFIISKTISTMPIPMILSILGIIMSIGGLIVWLLSYIYLGHSFGVLPKKQKRIKRGIYHSIPHPMYIGISATFIGLSVSLGSYPGLIITMFFLIPLLFLRAILEERALIQ